jgi:hypothetical protein
MKRIGLAGVLLACVLLAVACTPTAENPAPATGSGPAASVSASASAAPAAALTSAPAPAAGAAPASAAPASAALASAPQPYDVRQLDLRVTQATIARTIAVRGYTSSVRPPASVTSAIKRRLMREHHYVAPLSAYELDHFIPLEVGGSSNLANLWLEPIAEAKRKDVDENLAHKMVVSGQWTLAAGQQYIRTKWHIYYTQ